MAIKIAWSINSVRQTVRNARREKEGDEPIQVFLSQIRWGSSGSSTHSFFDRSLPRLFKLVMYGERLYGDFESVARRRVYNARFIDLCLMSLDSDSLSSLTRCFARCRRWIYFLIGCRDFFFSMIFGTCGWRMWLQSHAIFWYTVFLTRILVSNIMNVNLIAIFRYTLSYIVAPNED